jgi:hypothetical protein
VVRDHPDGTEPWNRHVWERTWGSFFALEEECFDSLHAALEAIERSPSGLLLDRLTMALQSLHKAAIRREQAIDEAVRNGTIDRASEIRLRDELARARQMTRCAEHVWLVARRKAIGGEPIDLARLTSSPR